MAFTKMVERNRATIYAVCYMFSKNADEVGDLFQEVLIKLWSGFDSFEGRSAEATWIYRASLNTCISYDRKRKARPMVPLTPDLNLFAEQTDDGELRQIRMLYDRVSRLGVFDRAIVLLWLENMSYAEIAAILGITEKNVSVRLYRIKEELKRMSNTNKEEL